MDPKYLTFRVFRINTQTDADDITEISVTAGADASFAEACAYVDWLNTHPNNRRHAPARDEQDRFTVRAVYAPPLPTADEVRPDSERTKAFNRERFHRSYPVAPTKGDLRDLLDRTLQPLRLYRDRLASGGFQQDVKRIEGVIGDIEDCLYPEPAAPVGRPKKEDTP